MSSEAQAAAHRSGLIATGEPLLVMTSGGADSCCLLDVAVKLGARVSALHVNYGLRGAESEADEALCRALCERLGVALHVERAPLRADAPGNLQARARDARYAAAERLAEGDYAAAHTRTDQAETVLYRLASSPGRRALLGMAPRRGRLVRPLLSVTRAATREHCRAAGIEWREDASNADPRFARARIRAEVLPALGERAEAAIAETALALRDEAEVLDAAVDAVLTDDLAAIAALPPALARLVLRRLADDASIGRERAEAILALAGRGGSASVEVGGGLRAVVEYGRLHFTRAHEDEAAAPAPEPVELPIPGSARFGDWELRAGSDGDVALDAAALGSAVTVRAWRPGDRMRPAGLGGTKTLQDLFTDRKVPRARRHAVPVLDAGGEIAWVPGVAVGEAFRAHEGARSVALAARLAPR
jgi:tRNA(Ile)-lysidine synthase